MSSSSSSPPVVLYNREEDLSKLIDTYNKLVQRSNEAATASAVAGGAGAPNTAGGGGARELVLLVGQPGNGKTTLGYALQSHIIQSRRDNAGGSGAAGDTFFISGKFDPFDHPEPFSPLLQAFTSYLDQIILSRRKEQQLDGTNTTSSPKGMPVDSVHASSSTVSAVNHVERVQRALLRIMDTTELQSLYSIIPKLQELMEISGAAVVSNNGVVKQQQQNNGKSSSSSAYISKSTTNKSNFLVTFCNMIRAISHPQYPIVLFIDNGQHSTNDTMCLDIIKVLMTDTKITGLLCMIAFRPVGVKHPFSLCLRALESSGITFVPILPTPLNSDNIDTILTTQVQYVELSNALNNTTTVGDEDDNDGAASSCSDRKWFCDWMATITKGNPLSIQLCFQLLLGNDKAYFLELLQYRSRSGGQDGNVPTPTMLQIINGDVKTLFTMLYRIMPTSTSPSSSSSICQKLCNVASCMGSKDSFFYRINSRKGGSISVGGGGGGEPNCVLDIDRIVSIIGYPGIRNDINDALEVGVEAGILTKTSAAPAEASSSSSSSNEYYYAFANWTYKDCIYNLLPQDDKKLHHTAIGNLYRQEYNSSNNNSASNNSSSNNNNNAASRKLLLYNVVTHMKLGMGLLSPKGKEALATLCLECGLDTSSWTEYTAATRYLDMGIKLLQAINDDDDDEAIKKKKKKLKPKHLDQLYWKTHHDLALSLYLASADVYKSTGKYSEMDSRLMEILQNTKKDSIDHFNAYMIQMQSLIARMMHTDAISLALKVYPKLAGESMPYKSKYVESELKSVKKLLFSSSSSKDGGSKEFKKEQALQQQQSVDYDDSIILQRKPMVDEKKLGAMTILNYLLSASFLGQQGIGGSSSSSSTAGSDDGKGGSGSCLIPIIACRMVKTTLQYGVTGISAIGLSVLGAVLCTGGTGLGGDVTTTVDIPKGLWCSEMAVQLVGSHDLPDAKPCKGRVMAIHWGIVSRYNKSWKQCQEPLKIAYRLCMEGGDNEFSLVSPLLSVFNMLAASGSLTPVAEAMKSVYQLLYKKNQDSMLRMIRPFFQEVLNLMGATAETDPIILSGSIMNEEEELRYANEHHFAKVKYCIYLCQAELAFLMHKHQRARELLDKCHNLGVAHETILSSLSIKQYFLDALTSVSLSWETEKDKKMAPREALKKKKKHLAVVTSRCEYFEQLAQHSPDNQTHRMLLLQAELKGLDGQADESVALFQKAMHQAQQVGAIGDAALACERTGLMLRMVGKEDDALDYLEDCCGMYRQYGALVKVNHVKGNVIPQAIYEWDN